MRYATSASGVEAPSVAFKDLPGWVAVWFSQFDPEHNYRSGPDFPSRVLAYRYPDVPNLGDMTKLHENKLFHDSIIDLFCAGTPCQGFSLAGLRGGLADQRSNLALEFCRILITKQPRWFLWENVPGVHSTFSNETDSEIEYNEARCVTQTSDFARLLEAFHECGYSVSWRILDSQHFGVPQRRRRVYVVGYLGTDWRPPFAVLFEQESLRRDLTPGQKEGQRPPGETVACLDASFARLQGASGQDLKHEHSHLVAYGGNNLSGAIDVTTTLKGTNSDLDFESETFIVQEPSTIDLRNYQDNGDLSGTLQSKGKSGYSLNYINPVIYDTTQITSKQNGSNPLPADPAPPLVGNGHPPVLTSEQLWSIMPQNSGNDYKARETNVTQPLVAGKGNYGNQGGDIIQQSVQVQFSSGGGKTENDTMQSLRANAEHNYQFIRTESFQPQASSTNNIDLSDVVASLDSSKVPGILNTQIIRRLTPLECERLQAFPDNYTFIPIRKVSERSMMLSLKRKKNKRKFAKIGDDYWLMAADGPRYQAMGNSMTTTVIRWIGQRIDKVDKLMTKIKDQK
jgi:DNA (cytosine-5)-methyltransferase 1